MTTIEENIRILERGLTAFADEFKEQGDIWRTLDLKAQGLIGGSTVFIAGAFAFSRETSLTPTTKAFVIFTLAALFFCLQASISVLRARNFRIPDGNLALNAARGWTAKTGTAADTRLEAYLTELLDDTKDVLSGLDEANDEKRAKLKTAQTWFAIAAYLSVGATLVHLVWSSTI